MCKFCRKKYDLNAAMDNDEEVIEYEKYDNFVY